MTIITHCFKSPS